MDDSNSANQSSTCVVGYALNAKKLRKSSHDGTTSSGKGGEPHKFESVENRKPSEYNWKGGGLSDILESSLSLSGNLVSDCVTFVQLDYEIPLAAQPKCDVIIHKLTEDIDNNSKESVAKIKLIDAYLKEFPRTVIVDPLSCVRKVISRARTCEHLSNIQRRLGKNCSFTQPAYFIAEEGVGTQEMADQLTEKGLSYPLICKPIQACGTPHSHNMMVIVSKEDLHLVTVPCVVQQYHDHDEGLYKVYVIDQDVMVFRRQSLPNLHLRNSHAGAASSAPSSPVRSLPFDSRKNYPTYSDFVSGGPEGPSGERKDETAPSSSANLEAPIPPELFDACQRTATAIREEFGLSLFGFDAILPNDRCPSPSAVAVKIVVIDVNYFPSYKEVSDFPFRLKNFLRSQMHAK